MQPTNIYLRLSTPMLRSHRPWEISLALFLVTRVTVQPTSAWPPLHSPYGFRVDSTFPVVVCTCADRVEKIQLNYSAFKVWKLFFVSLNKRNQPIIGDYWIGYVRRLLPPRVVAISLLPLQQLRTNEINSARSIGAHRDSKVNTPTSLGHYVYDTNVAVCMLSR